MCTSVTTLNTKQSVRSFINLNISCEIRQKQAEQIISNNTILEIGYEFLFGAYMLMFMCLCMNVCERCLDEFYPIL